MKFFTTLFFICYFYSVKSQTSNWINSLNAGDNDQINSTVIDLNGNTYVGGSFKSSALDLGTITLTNSLNGYPDFFIAKYNSNGTLLWAKQFGTGGYEELRSMCLTKENEIVFTGYYRSDLFKIGLTSMTPSGTIDNLFISKLDSAGNVIWAKSYGGGGYDYGRSVTSDNDNNIFLTGSFDSNSINFGPTSLSKIGQADIFIIKLNSNGNVLWAKNYGETGSEYPYEIKANPDGKLLLVGYYFGAQTKFDNIILNQPSGGFNSDGFIANIDSSGNTLWANSFGGKSWDYATSSAIDNQNNCTIIGSFTSDTIHFNNDTILKIGTTDAFILHFNGEGTLKWHKEFGYQNNKVLPGSVLTDKYQNLIFALNFSSNTINFNGNIVNNSGNSGTMDFIIVKTDKNCNEFWVQKSIGNKEDNISKISNNENGDLSIVGSFSSDYITIGNKTLYNNATLLNTIDSYVLQLKDEDFTSIFKHSNYQNIILYPNPSDNYFKCITNIEDSKIRIIDILGNEILSKNFNNQVIINTEFLSKGNYFVSINTPNGSYSKIITIIE